jgi:uncharacterized surface protein with fasciclin (FAS1) repeats
MLYVSFTNIYFMENKPNNTKSMIIAGIAAVVVLALGGFAYAQSEKKEEDRKNKDKETSMRQDKDAAMKKKEADDKMKKEDAMKKEILVGGIAMSPTNNLVQNASKAPNLTTVVTAVQAAGLGETLQGPGPFTVFAPDNASFTKLPVGTLETLLKPESKPALIRVLSSHVVSGKVLAADLTDGQVLTTLSGQTLKVSKSTTGVTLTSEGGSVAKVSQADVVSSNGVAHIVDTVLLPK